MYEESKVQSEIIRDLFAFMAEAKSAVSEDKSIDGTSFESFPLMPNQYLYFINFTTSEVPYHKNLDKVLGYTEKLDMPLLMNMIHPDDVDTVTKVSNAALEYLIKIKIKDTFAVNFTVSNRTRKKNGSFITVLRQMTIVDVDTQGNIQSALAVCSDISDIKTSNEVTYSLEGPNNDIFYTNVENILDKPPRPDLTERETEIIKLIAKGYSSKEIADLLFISPNTVITHRKNMMLKLEANNVVDLVLKSGIVIQ